jgi:hypothetical protein
MFLDSRIPRPRFARILIISLMRKAISNQAVGPQNERHRDINQSRVPLPSWLYAQSCLRAHNVARKAEGKALRDAIREIDFAHGGEIPLDAGTVRAKLNVAVLGRRRPTLRTIQLHLKATEIESCITHPPTSHL